MPAVLDMMCLDLGPTLTYAHRRCWWVPSDGTEQDQRDGTLTILVQAGRRSGCKADVDTYAVQRVDQNGSNAMGFYLVNETDPTQEQPYHCFPHEVLALSLCTCVAGDCRVPSGCKHRDALRLLIEQGVL